MSTDQMREALRPLIDDAWRQYAAAQSQWYLVQPSIPILFFGDVATYSRSPLRVLVAALNPSRAEFPSDDRFARFPAARYLAPTRLDHARYLAALSAYFPTQPLRRWFGALEPLLQGMDASFYPRATSTVLHTDLGSPLPTDPTWSGLPGGVQEELRQMGRVLWRSLVEVLRPHVILLSVARHHLDTLPLVINGAPRVL